MVFRLIDHTADLGLDIEADSLSGLFGEAAVGFVDCITEPDTIGQPLERAVHVESESLELLLVDWLSELLFIFETRDELYSGVEVSVSDSGSGWVVSGIVRGERFDEMKHRLKVPIKAVTYHQLRVTEVDGGWRARVIFDI